MILGKDLIVALNGTPLAAARSCNFSVNRTFISTASPISSRWEEFKPSRNSWSISTDTLVGTMETFNMLLALIGSSNTVYVLFYDTDRQASVAGYAYVETIHVTGMVNSLAKLSVTLKGTGKLGEYTGTPIATTVQETENGIYLAFSDDNVRIEDDNDSMTEMRSFTLSEQSNVRIYPSGINVVLTTDISIWQPISDRYDFQLSSYNGTHYSDVVNMQLNAGTYFLVCSYYPLGPAPIVTKMS